MVRIGWDATDLLPGLRYGPGGKFLGDCMLRRLFPQLPWQDAAHAPVAPATLGTTVFQDVPIADVMEFIDWNPFFQVRAMAGGRGWG